MELLRQVGGARFRMRWFDIEADSLSWEWQRAVDGGDWETLWAIAYRRRLGG
jgi:hypothetical protein